MKLKFFDIKVKLLDPEVTITQRGLLISIILLKDEDPVLWDAKIKAKINVKEHKGDLVLLHESKLIEWRGYKQAKKSLEEKKQDPVVIEIISFMNNLYGRNFDPASAASTTGLRNRLKKYTPEEIKKVISNRYLEWRDNPKMKIHLNPGTIFRPSKFEKYYEEAMRTKKGESISHADKIGLSEGEEITLEIVKSFVDREFYAIKTFNLNSDGARLGIGIASRMRGDHLKTKVKIESLRSQKEIEITYVKL